MVTSNRVHIEEWLGFEIVLDIAMHGRARFVVEFVPEDLQSRKYFDTHEKAREAIEDHNKTTAKSRSISLPVYYKVGGYASANIAPGTVTGINLHSNTVTGIKDPGRLYPRSEWVRSMFEDLKVAQAEVKRIEDKLAKVSFSERRSAPPGAPGGGRYGKITVENYGPALDALVKAHADATNIAEEMARGEEGEEIDDSAGF